MKDIKVLGTGCSKCKTTLRLIEEVATAKAVQIKLEKVEALPEIMRYGVMATPGVVWMAKSFILRAFLTGAKSSLGSDRLVEDRSRFGFTR